jgi:hypothetical protein
MHLRRPLIATLLILHLASATALHAASSLLNREPMPGSTKALLAPGAKDVFSIIFKGHADALVKLSWQPAGNVSLVVLDEFDRPLCVRRSINAGRDSNVLTCRWDPDSTAPVKAVVSNLGPRPISYVLLTN